VVRGEITLLGSWNSYSAPFPGVEWRAVLDYLADGRLRIKPFITHTFPLECLPQTIRDLKNKAYEYNKVVIVME